MLEKLFEQVIITQIIAEEFGKPLPNWVLIENPKDKINQIILEATLDKGEASAIALAMEQTDCLLIIDELKGRKAGKKIRVKHNRHIGFNNRG